MNCMLRITHDDGSHDIVSLDDLCAVDDGAASVRAEIEAALSRGESYVEGGGACPMVTVTEERAS